MKHTYIIEMTTTNEDWKKKRRELGIGDICYGRFHSIEEAQDWVNNYNKLYTVRMFGETARVIKEVK